MPIRGYKTMKTIFNILLLCSVLTVSSVSAKKHEHDFVFHGGFNDASGKVHDTSKHHNSDSLSRLDRQAHLIESYLRAKARFTKDPKIRKDINKLIEDLIELEHDIED